MGHDKQYNDPSEEELDEQTERFGKWQREQTEKERQENFEKFRKNPGKEYRPPLFPLH